MKKRLTCLLVVLLILVISVPSFALFGLGDDQKEEKRSLQSGVGASIPKD